ncbi:helix-turn-helix domain-containing protein [Haploplasma axanthum]|uniref:HTH-type transcriptional regulator immR n=1 Tax=Haploplasma axanthum TaxID=29552 RepID=A0A449BEB6_HAPAX|nr:helix-turn-helix transcriptional regulator [Haploplasma axanthum]VEU80650.1 HTH-type transcriptional regulator immR [Haploplasma axanthum]
MTLGEKVTKLRKEKAMTQEQLAEILDVSRQSVSKWEQDIAYPETDKIIKIAKLFDVSLDYLLLDREIDEKPRKISFSKGFNYEYKSKKKILGMPLIHINIGFGKVAKGFISIGFISKGIISLGLISLGFLSMGLFSLGLISLAVFSLGIISLGAISFGVIAIGAIAIGVFSIGAVSVGYFSVGALAIGKYGAYGDTARALIAIGDTKSFGSMFSGNLESAKNNKELIINVLDNDTPKLLKLFKDWFLSITGLFRK